MVHLNLVPDVLGPDHLSDGSINLGGVDPVLLAVGAHLLSELIFSHLLALFLQLNF